MRRSLTRLQRRRVWARRQWLTGRRWRKLCREFAKELAACQPPPAEPADYRVWRTIDSGRACNRTVFVLAERYGFLEFIRTRARSRELGLVSSIFDPKLFRTPGPWLGLLNKRGRILRAQAWAGRSFGEYMRAVDAALEAAGHASTTEAELADLDELQGARTPCECAADLVETRLQAAGRIS